MSSPFSAAVEALHRPLALAAEDPAAVPDLESAVREAASRLRALAVPADLRKALAALERGFRSPLEPEARAAAVERALATIAPWREPGFVDDALARPVSSLPGVGPKRADSLARRGIANVAHLLFHLPSRFDDRRALSRIADLAVGQRATFVGRAHSGRAGT